MSKLIHHARRHFHKHYVEPHGPRAHLVLLIDSLLVGAILVLLGVGSYFAFLFNPLRDDFRFETKLDRPLVAGQPAVMSLKVANVGPHHLRDVRIQAHLPPEFLITDYPQDYDAVTEMTAVGGLAPGQSVDLAIKGTVFGPPGERPIFVRMTATDETEAQDERVFEVRVSWKESLIRGSLSLPAKIVANQNVVGRYALENVSNFNLEHVRIVPHWPENFRPTATTPPVFKGEAEVGPIKTGEKAVFEFAGRAGAKTEGFVASVDAYWQRDGAEILIDRSEIGRLPIDVNLQVKASFKEPKAAYRPGEAVTVVLTYENRSAYDLRDVAFELPLDPRVFDPATPRFEFPRLGSVKAGASGSVEAELTLAAVPSRWAANPVLALKPAATFSVADGDSDSTVLVSGAGAEAKVSGTASLNFSGRYYTTEGEQLGRGPLPPKVGRETRYWIFASIGTGTSELADARLVIPLAVGARWTGKSSVSSGLGLQYDPAANALTWEIGPTSTHLGQNEEPLVASFEIGFTPTEAQSGKTPALTGPASFEAVDLWTGGKLQTKAPALTIALLGDTLARGKGTVRP